MNVSRRFFSVVVSLAICLILCADFIREPLKSFRREKLPNRIRLKSQKSAVCDSNSDENENGKHFFTRWNILASAGKMTHKWLAARISDLMNFRLVNVCACISSEFIPKSQENNQNWFRLGIVCARCTQHTLLIHSWHPNDRNIMRTKKVFLNLF